MPVFVRSEDAIEPADGVSQVSANLGWGDLGEASVLVQKGPKTFSKAVHEHLDLRTTLLVNATEWFLLEERVEWAKQDEPERELPHVADTLVTLFESSRLPARRSDPEDPAVQPEPEDAWVDEIEPNHFLTHLPEPRKCNVCLQSKLIAKPHRRLKHQSQNLRNARQAELPEALMQRREVDHMISYDQPSSDEEVVSLVGRDGIQVRCGPTPLWTTEAEEVEDALRHFCGGANFARCWVVHPSRGQQLPEPVEVPPPLAEGPSVEEKAPRMPRNRATAKLRIAVHGKSPACFGRGCGSYNHTVECRKRFNELLDFHEPLPDPAKTEMDEEDAYVPPEESEVPVFKPSPAPGERTEESAHGLMACAEILTDPDVVQEIPVMDDQVQTRFEEPPQCLTFGLPAKERQVKTVAPSSSILLLSQQPNPACCGQFGFEYVGLSKDFVDLSRTISFSPGPSGKP